MQPVSVPSLARFLEETREQPFAAEAFCNENARTVRVEVDGSVWIRPGAAIAYRGDLTFERLPTLEARSIGEALALETAPLVRAVGRGRLYCGHHGSHARVVRLEGDGLVVAWHALLAFQQSLEFSAALVGHGVGLAAGGLVTISLSGSGSLALATHGDPVTIPVSPGQSVSTDPHATLAWSSSLTPRLKTDLSWRSAFGHGGNQAVQMLFEGQGSVLVQPYQQAAAIDLRPNPVKQVAKLVTR
jgi:uncharacterized protein (AIM24 family)